MGNNRNKTIDTEMSCCDEKGCSTLTSTLVCDRVMESKPSLICDESKAEATNRYEQLDNNRHSREICQNISCHYVKRTDESGQNCIENDHQICVCLRTKHYCAEKCDTVRCQKRIFRSRTFATFGISNKKRPDNCLFVNRCKSWTRFLLANVNILLILCILLPVPSR